MNQMTFQSFNETATNLISNSSQEEVTKCLRYLFGPAAEDGGRLPATLAVTWWGGSLSWTNWTWPCGGSGRTAICRRGGTTLASPRSVACEPGPVCARQKTKKNIMKSLASNSFWGRDPSLEPRRLPPDRERIASRPTWGHDPPMGKPGFLWVVTPNRRGHDPNVREPLGFDRKKRWHCRDLQKKKLEMESTNKRGDWIFFKYFQNAYLLNYMGTVRRWCFESRSSLNRFWAIVEDGKCWKWDAIGVVFPSERPSRRLARASFWWI